MALLPFGSAPTPNATASKAGKVQLAGDLGNTATSPQVVSTHLSAALPINQGGTGLTSTSQNFSFLGPTSGSGAPSWRALTTGDLPTGIDHHANLTNFTANDDHTQYALLAGRSGGQTLIGGTASGNALTFNSTSNATKGLIQLGGGTTPAVWDEANSKFIVHGTSHAAKRFAVDLTDTTSSASSNYISAQLDGTVTFSTGTNSNTVYTPFWVSPSVTANTTITRALGLASDVNLGGTGAVTDFWGFNVSPAYSGSGGLTNFIAARMNATHSGASTIGTATGVAASMITANGSATVTTYYGFVPSIAKFLNLGTVTTAVGFKVDTTDLLATTNWGLQIGLQSQHKGKIGFGGSSLSSAPTYGIDLMSTSATTGAIGIASSATPTNPSSGNLAMYVKGTKLIIAFNNAGTMAYFYLDGTQTTNQSWIYSATAP